MANDYRASIERLRERLEDSDEIADADAEALGRYSRELDALGQAEVGVATHEKYLMRLVKMAEEVGGLADALEEEAPAKRLNAWVNEHYPNPESNKTGRDSLRSFGTHATDGEEVVEPLAWIPTGYPSDYNRKPDPSKMFRWEEHVVPMLEACRNFRDEALIGLAFDIGPRSGELQDLTLGDFADNDFGLQVTVDGKQGRRSPTLMIAPDRVNLWLQNHPGRGDPSAPLWSRLNSPDSVSPNMIRKVFRKAAERAAITPPSTPTPTRFRKSSASHLAARNVSQAHLETRYGWTRGSDEAARYIAVFGSETDREVARALGIDVDVDDPEPMGPLNCPRCELPTPRDKPTCVHCGQALSVEAAAEAEAQQKRARKTLAMLDPDTAEEVLDTLDLLTDPSVRGQLQALSDHD